MLPLDRQRFRLLAVALSALVLTGPATAPVGAALVFSTTFDSGAPPEFSGARTTAVVQGYSGIGPSGNQFGGRLLWNTQTGNPAPASTLSLSNLPPHASVSLGFLLALMDSWDGTSPFWGTDFFNVRVDGVAVFSRSFSNFTADEQTYPPPAGVLLTPRPFPSLGFDTTPDAAYNLGLEPSLQNIPHTASTLTVAWFASGPRYRQESTDESWGIDNVRVSVNPVPTGANFDGDNDVDGTDLQRWRAGFGNALATHAQGDADADQDVDGGDLLVWQRQLGPVANPVVAAPEPGGVCAIVMMAGAGFRHIRPRRRVGVSTAGR